MTEKTRKKIIISTLPAAVIWAVFNLGGDKSSDPPPAPPTVAAISPVAMASPNSSLNMETVTVMEEFELSAWGDDPFRLKKLPKISSPRATSVRRGWSLSGILYNANDPVAIVNKRPVRVGQNIDGATVLNIEQNRVILEHNGKRQTLRVSKG